MALPAVKKQQNRLPAKAAEKDKEEDFFENKKSRHNQLSKPLQEEQFILKMIAPVFSFLSLLKYFINTNSQFRINDKMLSEIFRILEKANTILLELGFCQLIPSKTYFVKSYISISSYIELYNKKLIEAIFALQQQTF